MTEAFLTLRREGAKKKELEVVDYSGDSVAEECCSEIDQEPQLVICESQIGEQLFFMYRLNLFHRLQFNNYLVCDDQVRAERFIKGVSVICDWYGSLSVDVQSPFVQFGGEDDFVYRF